MLDKKESSASVYRRLWQATKYWTSQRKGSLHRSITSPPTHLRVAKSVEEEDQASLKGKTGSISEMREGCMLMTDFRQNIVSDLESPITILTRQTSSESQSSQHRNPPTSPCPRFSSPTPCAEFLQPVPYISPDSPARFTCMEFRMANRYSVISRVPEKFRKATTHVTPSRGHSRAAALAPFLQDRDTNGR